MSPVQERRRVILGERRNDTNLIRGGFRPCSGRGCGGAENFNRVASFPTIANMPDGEDTSRTSSAEIITASEDGMTLVYSDSPLGVIGMIDITDPANPQPKGNIVLDGEPTAVSALGNTVFVGINTRESFTNPSGHLLHIDLATGEAVADCDLGGQPDSTAVAPDGSLVTIAIENERDEDAGDGRVPQMPAGYVAIVPLDDSGMMLCDQQIRADVTGLADVAPEDPEPEFVDVNAAGEIVVTMQENNHIVVLSSAGEVLSHFSAGAVDLDGIDATDEPGCAGSSPKAARPPARAGRYPVGSTTTISQSPTRATWTAVRVASPCSARTAPSFTRAVHRSSKPSSRSATTPTAVGREGRGTRRHGIRHLR